MLPHLIGAIVMVPLYYLEIPFFEHYKAFDDLWPWKTDPNWFSLLKEALMLNFVNVVVQTLLTAFIPYYLGEHCMFDCSVEGVPTLTTFFLQIIFCALMEDISFHFSHRMLHTKWLY